MLTANSIELSSKADRLWRPAIARLVQSQARSCNTLSTRRIAMSRFRRGLIFTDQAQAAAPLLIMRSLIRDEK